MNQIAIDFGIIKIYWYSITMFFAMLTGGLIFYKQAKNEKIKEDIIINYVFYTIISSILGARIYYVLFNLDYYLKNPIEIIEIWNGGLAIHGGIIAGGIFLIYYSKKNKINYLKIFDMASLGLIIAQVIGRWGNFFNQEAHGPVTTLQTLKNIHIPAFIIKGMNINGKYYHPTFLYEGIWNFIGFILMLTIKKKKELKPGQLTGIYMIWYSIGRFIIEQFRTDSLMLGNLKIAQLVSIILLLIGIYLIIRKKPKTRVNINKERINNYEN